ncbi:DUF7522 family protein [Natronomonas sp. EA1]|uniref:DUF7522 family protein n=1 Tax=Natronomonas sp. EA1 TaxID=3421655 RepID=UPI003EB92D96
MSIQASESLARFFKEEAGEDLRLVAHYTDRSVEFVYLREDLESTYDERDFQRTFDVHRQDRIAARKQSEVIDAGEHHCTLRVYDDAIVFNVAQTDDIGTIVSVNPDVGKTLLTFITRTLEQLHHNSPQEVTPPTWLTD